MGVCWWSVGDGDCIMALGWLLGGGRMVMVSFGKRVIRVSVEAIPVDFVEPRTLLEAQPEDNEGFVRQDNEEAEEDILDEFYWSVESDESDHEEDHESGQDGQGSGVVEGMETGQGKWGGKGN
ncbi:hypothetical protein Patl1_14849 [Pistacia atlantica]|uniref:Uncharacterized protein n=1 Tax=Pistacia atlantica TaxID=434234 RepID=A0ACC1AS04_9ROSI|nr:hypothetical protein Patl1_14849 [Pistacia atlantica]